MGTYTSTYLGIYLLVPYGTERIISEKITNPRTGKIMEGKFCPHSGVEGIITEYVAVNHTYPNLYDNEIGLDEDMFMGPEYHGGSLHHQTFIMNGDNKYSIKIDDNDYNVNIDLSDMGFDPSSLIDVFSIEYKDYLDYFEKEFGKPKVYWGLVNYAN